MDYPSLRACLCFPVRHFLLSFGIQKPGHQRKRRFLIRRGFWLLLLEFTVVNFGIWFDIRFSVLLFQVIAAIGLGLICLGLIVLGRSLKVPAGVPGVVGLAVICLHNLLPPGVPFFAVSVLPVGQAATLIIGYPPAPWIAIMLLGYWLGGYLTVAENRQRLFLRLGSGCLGIFTVLRVSNLYGDPAPWFPQESVLWSIMSFLNVTKYPPSLLYCLLMLGSMFLLLGLAERMKGRPPQVLTVYGKVPLCYYLLHWYLVHLTLFVVLFIQGFNVRDFVFGFRFGRPEAVNGLPLGGIYLIWAGVVCLLYPFYRWYSRFKFGKQSSKWLRYL